MTKAWEPNVGAAVETRVVWVLATRGSRRFKLATGETVRSWSQTHLHVCGFVHEATGKPEDPEASYRVDWVSKAGSGRIHTVCIDCPLTDLDPELPEMKTGLSCLCYCYFCECSCLCSFVCPAMKICICVLWKRIYVRVCAYQGYMLSSDWLLDGPRNMMLQQPHLCQATRFSNLQ